MADNSDDFIDGCEEDFAAESVSDRDLDGIVLFGDSQSIKEVEEIKAAWEVIFNA